MKILIDQLIQNMPLQDQHFSVQSEIMILNEFILIMIVRDVFHWNNLFSVVIKLIFLHVQQIFYAICYMYMTSGNASLF